jgi:hypothetical protein
MTSHNNIDISNIDTLYKFLVEESIKSIDIIKKQYPTLESDTINMKHIITLKENNPKLIQDELTAHAFAFMVLIHLINISTDK